MDSTSVRAVDLYRALWRHAEGARGTMVAATLLLLASQSIKLAIPWLAAQAIDALQTGGLAAARTAAGWVAAILGATAASWALHGPGRILERNVAIRVRERLQERLFARLFGAPLAWHEMHHSGETIDRVSRSTGALYDFAQSQFVYLQNAVSLVGPLAALAWLSPRVGLAATLGYGLVLLAVVRFDRSMMRHAAEENAALRRLQAAQVDALGNVVSVLALRLEAATGARLRERLAAVFGPLRRMIVINEAKWCSVDLASTAVWGAVLALYVWLARLDAGPGAPLLLGGVFMVHQYAMQAGGVLTAIASHYQSFARHRADFASAQPVLDAPADGPRVDAGAAAGGWTRLDVESLSFSHPARRDRSRPTLDAFAASVRRGERIALVGASGSGKSSLLRALAGLYRADEVVLRLDGRPVSPTEVAARATLIPQDAEVFEGTLRENLTMAGEADDATLLEALRIACLDPWIAASPDGLETRLSERGGNLSGGQRQRVAFARGWIAARASTLLLLDEPTSSLDPTTEATLLERAFASRPDAAVLASVHRLHLLERFDTVWWLEHGRLVAAGPPRTVAAEHPQFAALLERSRSPAEG
ncbi:MAG TPA: ABC transporter ATP-binding protein [Burkholderiaceae bacterium]|nr:ABC transporter ATP-binding protein [Burkholderiaceae bacterium]